jgi:hypothetical protein
VKVGTDPVDGVVVRLSSGATIVGTATGLDERELSLVNVSAFGPGIGSFHNARVDHRGAFRIEHVRPGRWELRGRVGGEGRQAQAELTVPDEGGEVPVELVFGQGVVLRGQVLQDERPVGGATIYVEGLDVTSSGWSSTDSEGGFVIDGLEEGRFRINVRSWESGLSHAEEVDVSGGKELVISVPTTRLSGRVVDAADGEPLAGARLTLRRSGVSGGPEMPGALGTTTDLDGGFVITPVTDGEWELAAEKAGFAVERVPVHVESGRAPPDLTVRLDATEGITLLVKLPSGRPAPEVTVAVLDAMGGVLTSGRFSTGEGGKLRIASVPPGTWIAVLSAPGSAVITTQVSAPDAPAAIELPPPTSVRVVVPALADAPAPGRMSVTAEDGMPHAVLGWFGSPAYEWPVGREFVVDRLPPGRYVVAVTTADGASFSGRVTTTAAARAELVLD